MIFLISGGRSSGKTETVKTIFQRSRGRSSGFITFKNRIDCPVFAYDLEDLNTSEKIPFIREKKTDIVFPQSEENRRFLFNKEVYRYVQRETEERIKNCDSFFLDEIGRLELDSGKGFFSTLLFLLENTAQKDLYLSVSMNNLQKLEEMLKKRALEYRVINKISIAAVLMASGGSIRFGEENKLLKKINSDTVFGRVLKAAVCADVFSEIFVITKYDEIIREAGNFWNVKCLYNEKAQKGISESVKIGVKAADTFDCDGYMFIPCDQLFLTENTIKEIACAFIRESSRITVPVYNGNQGSPVIFPRQFSGRLLELCGDNGGREIVLENLASINEVEIKDSREILDIDTTDDYISYIS